MSSRGAGALTQGAPMSITIELSPSSADVATLVQGMRAFEVSVFPDLPNESADVRYYSFVRDTAGKVIAGVQANCFWDGVEIEILWVAPAHRRQGLASRLMTAAEDHARGEGAVIAYLRTVMARAFYESIGYQVYGVLEDRPIGSQLYHMKKRLDGSP